MNSPQLPEGAQAYYFWRGRCDQFLTCALPSPELQRSSPVEGVQAQLPKTLRIDRMFGGHARGRARATMSGSTALSEVERDLCGGGGGDNYGHWLAAEWLLFTVCFSGEQQALSAETEAVASTSAQGCALAL